MPRRRYTKTGVPGLLNLKYCFWRQRANSDNRGIPWELTFCEWLEIWNKSGHLKERGVRVGQYVMARNGDKGPYAINNVEIKLCSLNSIEANLGKKAPPELRQKLAEARKGMKFSTEHKTNLSNARRKWWDDPANRALMVRRRIDGWKYKTKF